MYSYKTSGTCSKMIHFDVVDGKITGLHFDGGCNGNLQGIGKLVEGRPIDEVIDVLGGITCGPRSTSCPDQLARALAQVKEGR